MLKPKTLFLIPLIVILVLAGLFSFAFFDRRMESDPDELRSMANMAQTSPGQSAQNKSLIGMPVPDFVLPGIDPRHADLSSDDLKHGQVVVVNFFASWCVPCKAEMPVLKKLAVEHGITVHGIAMNDKAEKIQKMLKDYGDPFSRIGLDKEMMIAVEWGILGAPETYVITGEGKIAYRHIGPLTDKHIPSILKVIRKEQIS